MPQGQIHGWLVDVSGGQPGNRYTIEGDEITIGRGSSCLVRLTDPKVSRSHARVKVQRGQVSIEDLKSAHGVLVNGQVGTSMLLHDGDRIQLGDTYLQVELVQDAIGTVMAPSDKRVQREPACIQCGSPFDEGDAYCGTCGSIPHELPEPFGFIQKAYLQLRALHRAGKMDAATYRAELEKLVVADGSGGYWMVGIESGRWHWYDGQEWIRREPPTQALAQAPPLKVSRAVQSASIASSTPEHDPVSRENREGRIFIIGGGTLVAFAILAIGVFAASRIVSPGEDLVPQEMNLEVSDSTDIIIASPGTEGTIQEQLPSAGSATTSIPQPSPTVIPLLPFEVHPYDPAGDQDLDRLADFAEFSETKSKDDHAVYEGRYETGRPASFNIGWCAIDEPTLNANLQIIEMSLELDDQIVPASQMYADAFADSEMACRSYRMVIEFFEPGEHRLLWSTTHDEPVFDGWETYATGTHLNEYVFEIRDVVSIVDEFEVSDGTWFETVQTNFDQWIEDGVFNILVHKDNFFTWSLYDDLEVDDLLILTDAKRLSAVEGAYGIVFRLQDVNNFYYFLVDDSGYFTLGKRLAGEWVALIDWTRSEFILSGEDYNSLGVIADGEELVGYINLELVGQVVDASFKEGGVGVAAQSNETTGELHAIFDVFSLDYYP